ncbi:conserved protein, unknown function [Hepatocystis sp. ex Piliocolobus tephrosceles]|nr:conserved protein, unknown function [Hepatocystis sp. ex Piliocolobus tephrosceles]
MFYILKNTIRNCEFFNNVKMKHLVTENYLKSEKNVKPIFNQFLFNLPYSYLFFNNSFIYLENKKTENNSNVLLFNKVRNDKKHRKRGFQKRGYWKKMHYFTRKNNMMCYAFKVQNIDYEKIKKLKRGEVYSS